ncbi:NUD1 [Candida pseudojiufengensis]|uniref:NUD1 n=1 Tax=Candida pseudojiufengensis TaxID=497109 RepID=UPI002224390F|nr:NUD1 [Candida pseudojiufengensis]KAI5961615.1 NUD1 [Candida pseudojiufengensis]
MLQSKVVVDDYNKDGDNKINLSINNENEQKPPIFSTQLPKQKSKIMKQTSFLAPRQQSIYQKKIEYKQNYNFSGNKSSIIEDHITNNHNNSNELSNPSLSVPNTFHHKSHPNAKSKELGSTFINDDHTNNSDQHHQNNNNSNHQNKTPNWMPEELNENWPQSFNIEKPKEINSQKTNEPTTINTIVHNSDIQLKENLPWQNKYKSPAPKNLQHLFNESKEITDTSSPFSKPTTSSPMKIFGGNYDTYTKQQFNDVLQNIASNKNTPAHINSKPILNSNQQILNKPNENIKAFTKTGSYNGKSYMTNANNIFKNLERKFKSGDVRVVSQDTATSTPKRKVDTEQPQEEIEYASYTTGYSSDEKSEIQIQKSNEYTMISKSEESEEKSEEQSDEKSSEIQIDELKELTFDDNDSSYTHESTEEEEEEEEIQDLSINNTITQIKLKSPSKLRKEYESPIINGEIQPNLEILEKHGNMIYDEENFRWINQDENYTLDGLSDLEEEQPKKKEVSFHKNVGDITAISQIQDISFSESKKELISVLTDVLEELSVIDWNNVEEIDVSNKQLKTLNGLSKCLPSLKDLDASNNELIYLSGIPNVIKLNLSNNKIENRSTLNEFTKLRNLSLSNNYLTNINLLNNIQLTYLNLSNNNLNSLNGLRNLKYLSELSLCGNQLEVIDLADYEFNELRNLNVSNNRIVEIKNINHLTKLRVLNCDYNSLEVFQLSGFITKLQINHNFLKLLDVRGLKNLRCLKFDNNLVEQFLTKRGNGIEKISCKFQPNEIDFSGCLNLKVLNISGCSFIPKNDNITHLTMNAGTFKTLPKDFATQFFNLQYLNLNFNHFKSLKPLSGLKKLYYLSLVSNDLSDFYETMNCLKSSKNSLVVLDQRLNPFTFAYPYVFFPDETPIQQLKNIEDLETFEINLKELSNGEWQERNNNFISNEILNYRNLTMLYFQNLKKLDEDADVLVLTTPGNHYVDIRIFKQYYPCINNNLPFDQVFELCLAGKEVPLTENKIKFESIINSQSLKDSFKTGKIEIDDDIGEFSEYGLDRKEIGKMKNGKGVISPYIEIWRSLDPSKHSPKKEVRESTTESVEFSTYELKTGLGKLIQLGNWKQGIIQLENDIIVLRSWFNGHHWDNLIKYGDISKFNIDNNLNWVCIEKN